MVSISNSKISTKIKVSITASLLDIEGRVSGGTLPILNSCRANSRDVPRTWAHDWNRGRASDLVDGGCNCGTRGR
jgi:hypothetical protein